MMRRFDEVKLGESVEHDDPSLARLPWEERAQRIVAVWAGSNRICVASARQGETTPTRVTGVVYGRHLDGSRCVDVRVLGHHGETVCASALVRVGLA